MLELVGADMLGEALHLVARGCGERQQRDVGGGDAGGGACVLVREGHDRHPRHLRRLRFRAHGAQGRWVRTAGDDARGGHRVEAPGWCCRRGGRGRRVSRKEEL